VPERYGRWQSIYHLFRRWQREQIWAPTWVTLQGFADAAGSFTRQGAGGFDDQRAHQRAAGVILKGCGTHVSLGGSEVKCQR
jgi:transposase